MEQIDMNKLSSAIVYVQRIADGKNPVNNHPLETDTIINDPNVIRCMYFIRDVLKKVYDNNGIIVGVASKSKRADLSFPYEVLKLFEYKEDKSISKLIDQIYSPVEGQGIKKISGARINAWMMSCGYITEIYSEEFMQNIKVPTEKGEVLGLRAERVVYKPTGRTYISILYNKQAQEFIVANMEKILKGEMVD